MNSLVLYSRVTTVQTTTTATNPTLQIGSQGLKVKELQELLNRRVSRDYFVIVDGIFGSKTERAVKVFQYSVLLKSDGIVGLKTWKALSTNSLVDMPSLRRGSSGETVKIVQQVLKDGNFYTGLIDGDFGSKTEAAVKVFQKDRGVMADGIIGNSTWQALRGLATYLAFD
jgi:peptidoglycan hydrolase-like protein with peptidoglycan-binding domain